MKNKLTKMLLVMTAVILAFGLTACGGDKKDSDKKDADAQQTADDKKDDAAATDASDDEIYEYVLDRMQSDENPTLKVDEYDDDDAWVQAIADFATSVYEEAAEKYGKSKSEIEQIYLSKISDSLDEMNEELNNELDNLSDELDNLTGE